MFTLGITHTSTNTESIPSTHTHDLYHHWLPWSRLVVQIHDELVLEVPDEVAEQVARKVQALLESCSLLQSLSQPLKVRPRHTQHSVIHARM